MVIAAAGIEVLVAAWTTELALQVLVDGQLRAAGATENCFLVPFTCGPDFN